MSVHLGIWIPSASTNSSTSIRASSYWPGILAGHLLIKPGIWLAARLPALGRAAVESTGHLAQPKQPGIRHLARKRKNNASKIGRNVEEKCGYTNENCAWNSNSFENYVRTSTDYFSDISVLLFERHKKERKNYMIQQWMIKPFWKQCGKRASFHRKMETSMRKSTIYVWRT